MVVSSTCEADSHRAGARYQLPIFQWMVFRLQETPLSEPPTPARKSQRISVWLFSVFIVTSAEKQLRVSRSDLWANGLHAK